MLMSLCSHEHVIAAAAAVSSPQGAVAAQHKLSYCTALLVAKYFLAPCCWPQQDTPSAVLPSPC